MTEKEETKVKRCLWLEQCFLTKTMHETKTIVINQRSPYLTKDAAIEEGVEWKECGDERDVNDYLRELKKFLSSVNKDYKITITV